MKRISSRTIGKILIFLWVTGMTPPAGPWAFERENAVVRVAKQVSPAVVNISTEQVAPSGPGPFQGQDPFFDWFFRDFFEPGRERRYERASLGSGVIIDGQKGFVLTNAHVIDKKGKITVTLIDEREYEAAILGADPESDVAVLKVSSEERLPEARMGQSGDLMIGEDVIAIGNPFGFSHTVTRGVISALNRTIRTEDTVYHDFIQTDASINPGNSGGPLLNINGELIGINTAIYAKAQGIGFAIPIDRAKRVVTDLIVHGEVPKTWIGVTVQDITPQMIRYLRLRTPGVMVVRVDSDSPAARAGIREGDIVTDMGGISVASASDFSAAMKGFAPGDTVRVSIWREGEPIKKTLKAMVFPEALAGALGYDVFGIRVQDIPSGGGVAITEIRPRSYLAEIGARPGDIIRKLDDIPIAGVKDFEKAVVASRNKRSVVMLLFRGDQGYYITVRL